MMQKIESTSPLAQSADLIKDNIAKLSALFPELLTEGASGAQINLDVLQQLIGKPATDVDEKYGLNWHGKRRARQLALTPSTGTLRPCVEESVDWDTTQNLMIEGDNLEVLKLLQKSYSGKVKLIYIDPPYNTGKDFVYPDNFQDNIKNYLELTGQVEGGQKISSNTEASGRFHTEWLNMIYPRLKLARNLLRDDGVVLVSIDEHEVTNLRRVMDEILGEENFLSCITWEKGRKNDAKFFSNGHEYVVVYAKSQGHLREKSILWREEKPGARDIWGQYSALREEHGENEKFIEAGLQAWYSNLPKAHPAKKWSRYKRVDKHGPWRDRDISWPGGGGPRYAVLHPITLQACKVPERGWIYSNIEEMQRQITCGLVEFRADHTEPPFRKAHIRPIPLELETIDGADDESESGEEEELATQVRGSYFYKQSQVSVRYLRELLGAKVFNNPKDMDEIGRLIRYTTSADPDAVILDFFAGSGTTGEAVMRLNAEDGGNRRYIIVQLPEPLDITNKEQKIAAKFCNDLKKPKTIAELTKERLRRAATKIKAESLAASMPAENAHGLFEEHLNEVAPSAQKQPADTGFRVFKLAPSNIRAWNPHGDDMAKSLLDHEEHLLPGRSEQDILYELLLKLGLDLCVPTATRTFAGKDIYAIGGGVLFACLTEHITRADVEALVQGIITWHKELAPAGEPTCVFRDSAFADDVTKTNLAAILEQSGIKQVRSL